MSTHWEERQARNDKSRAWAAKHHQPWSSDEDEFLMAEWVNVDPERRDEVTVAQCLERTIEACRVRAEVLRGVPSQQRGPGHTHHVVRVTRSTTVEYIGVHDDPEDCYWLPEYYNTPTQQHGE